MKVVQTLFARLNLHSLKCRRPECDSNKTEARFFTGAVGVCLMVMTSASAWAGTTYTWNQTGSASWAVAGNWTPTRTTPATDDILVFNNGATTTATGVPAQTIGQLQVSGNTIVTLQAAAGVTLTVSGGAGAFSVGAGSTLTNAGASAITINLPTLSSGSISGLIDFTGGGHRLTAADASGVTFQNGATFVADTG